jgi:hypothetical protein
MTPEEIAWRRRGAHGVFDRTNNISISEEECKEMAEPLELTREEMDWSVQAAIDKIVARGQARGVDLPAMRRNLRETIQGMWCASDAATKRHLKEALQHRRR